MVLPKTTSKTPIAVALATRATEDPIVNFLVDSDRHFLSFGTHALADADTCNGGGTATGDPCECFNTYMGEFCEFQGSTQRVLSFWLADPQDDTRCNFGGVVINNEGDCSCNTGFNGPLCIYSGTLVLQVARLESDS